MWGWVTLWNMHAKEMTIFFSKSMMPYCCMISWNIFSRRVWESMSREKSECRQYILRHLRGLAQTSWSWPSGIVKGLSLDQISWPSSGNSGHRNMSYACLLVWFLTANNSLLNKIWRILLSGVIFGKIFLILVKETCHLQESYLVVDSWWPVSVFLEYALLFCWHKKLNEIFFQ